MSCAASARVGSSVIMLVGYETSFQRAIAGANLEPARSIVINSQNTRFRPELVDPTAYIAPGAVVLGNVTLGAEASVWFNAVIRGDTDAIRIGGQSNIQDGCV